MRGRAGAMLGVVSGLVAVGTFFWYPPTNEDKFRDNLKHYCEKHLDYYQFNEIESKAIFLANGLMPELTSRGERAILRRYFLEKFFNPTDTTYAEFVGSQPQRYYLTQDNFTQIANLFPRLSVPAKNVLRSAAFICRKDLFEEQLTLWKQALSPLEQQMLRGALGIQANLHELINIECNQTLFVELYDYLRNRIVTPEQVDLWFAHEVLELAAQNIDQNEFKRGSSFLINTRVMNLLLLKKEIESFYNNNAHDVYTAYVSKRTALLKKDVSYVNYLACLMEITQPDDFKTLKLWFEKQRREERNCLNEYYDAFNKGRSKTIQGSSEFVANLCKLRGVEVAASIYSSVFKKIKELEWGFSLDAIKDRQYLVEHFLPQYDRGQINLVPNYENQAAPRPR